MTRDDDAQLRLFERLRVHRLDEKLQTGAALDQNALDVARRAADMARQRGPRGLKQTQSMMSFDLPELDLRALAYQAIDD